MSDDPPKRHCMTRSNFCLGTPSWWGWIDAGPGHQFGAWFCKPCLDHVRDVEPFIDSFRVTERELLIAEIMSS